MALARFGDRARASLPAAGVDRMGKSCGIARFAAFEAGFGSAE
jgi:hypothetical protein